MQRSPSPGRRLARWAPALAVAATAGLAGCSSSPTASSTTTSSSALTTTTTTQRGALTTSTTVSVPTTSTVLLSGSTEDRDIAAAWVASINAFYVASELDRPGYGPLVATLVSGGPVQEHTEAYILTQSAMGVAGPATWRIGNVRVVSVGSATAEVVGCSYDPGSHYKSTGGEAPTDLGGGAGFTGYASTLDLIDGRWLVDTTVTTAPPSSSVAGPCHGF